MSASEAAHPIDRVPDRRGAADVLDYYHDAGPDYAAWSTKFNMHFGLIQRPSDLFHRERMLDQMSAAVLERLQLGDARAMVVDLGCGLGATMRYGAPEFPNAWFVGATIVDWQVEQAREMNLGADGGGRLEVFRS